MRQGDGILGWNCPVWGKWGSLLWALCLEKRQTYHFTGHVKKETVSALVCSPLKCLCCSQAFKLVHHWLTKTSIGLTFSRTDFWSCALSWYWNNWPNFSEVMKIPLTSSLHPETFKKITPGSNIWKSLPFTSPEIFTSEGICEDYCVPNAFWNPYLKGCASEEEDSSSVTIVALFTFQVKSHARQSKIL